MRGPCAILLDIAAIFFGFDDRPLSWGLFVCRAEALRFEVTVGFDPAVPTPGATRRDEAKGDRP
jgi:hypothetical protein